MSERTALEIADQVDAYVIRTSIEAEAAAMLRQQHAEIEQLKSDAELVNSCAKNLAIAMHRKNFSHITQWEPLPDTRGLISQIDNMSYWTRDDVARLTASREAAIASAVAAEREACAVVCIAQADRLEGPSDACGIALVCAGLIRARTKP